MSSHRDATWYAEMSAMIAQHLAAALPNIVTQVNQNNNNNNNNFPMPCNYKQFNSAKPLKFNGSE